MTFRQFCFLATAALILPISTFAWAEARPTGAEIVAQQRLESTLAQNERRQGSRGPRWLQELDLSPEQSEQIQSIREQARPEKESLREQLREARTQLQSLLSSNATDGQLRQQHQQIQELHQQLSDQRFENMLAIRQILTPEQRTQAAEFISQRRGRGHHGPRHRDQ
ncbi:MAG: Spy/CpxP family protein refolding chaperone [Cyanothece sp. SIO1E1]|nr:Spy/CpxP family protein refolding chaperone [Cyanothece sp. SIO1E1]